MSDNIFDDESLDPSALSQEEVLQDEILDDQAGAETVVDQHISEAMQRIEQAQLYKTLITHSLFQPGSARPEILTRVTKELRDFAQHRLEVLVGVRPDTGPVIAASNQFSDEQAKALRALADRALQRSIVQPTPTLNPVMAQPNVLTPVRPAGQPSLSQPGAPKKAAPARPVRKTRTANVSEKNPSKDYSQAKTSSALPMPSPEAMNSRIAQEVDLGHSRAEANPTGALINAIARVAMADNKQ